MKRTISLKIVLCEGDVQILSELQIAFVKACTLVYESSQEVNRIKLHHEVYRTIRHEIPQIGSQMACNAIAKVAACRKALKGKRPCQFRETGSVHYDKRTYSLKNEVLSLFTLRGRKQFKLIFGAFQREYFEKGMIKEAELVRKGKRFFFNLVLDLPDPIVQMEGMDIAVDFGENVLAAMSNGKMIKGGKLKSDRDKFLATRARLQSKGSQSAKQRLRQISGRERRHVKHVNHSVAKEIVQEAVKNGCSVIILEDLKNIRERIKGGKKIRSRLHRWPFNELRQFVEYKAQAQGIGIQIVNPAFSSQICSTCSEIGERHKHRFTCFNCGSLQHSDLNASRNLLRLGLSADRSTGVVNHRHVAAISGQ